MKSTGVIVVFLALLACTSVPAEHPRAESGSGQPKALRDLVSPGDPLARHGLLFDGSFVQVAIAYLRSGDSTALERLAKSPAAAHLLNHARNFDYDVPKDSPGSLVSHLLTPPGKHQEEMKACEENLAFFSGQMVADPHWVGDSLRYLPTDFRFHGALFLTYGYDIGVAFGPTASLNCAHPHFRGHPRELIYYAIHELHHVGFMSYQPPPKISEMKACADLVRLVEYSTQMEGMAVLAAEQRRRDEQALSDDDDYVDLEDGRRLRRDETKYFEDLHYLEGRSNQPADGDAWAVIDRMSSGDRLWYRVGARMAQEIERTAGREALVALIKKGPASFRKAYESVHASHIKMAD